MSKIIGIIGPRGSGKTTFVIEAAAMLNCGIGIVRVADILKETLELWSLHETRENIDTLAEKMREGFGERVLADAVKIRVEQTLTDVLFVEGIRGPNVVRALNDAEDLSLVYIDAPQRLRYERVSVRKEKEQEYGMGFEKFAELDMSKREQELKKFKDKADYVIANEGTYEEFVAAIKKCLHDLGLPTV